MPIPHLWTVLPIALLGTPSPQGVGPTEAVLEVCCGSEGITAARQRVEWTVDDGDPTTPKTTVTVTLPRTSTSRDFANILCHDLKAKGIGCHTGESSAERFRDKAATTEALYLHEPFTLDAVVVEMKAGHTWQPDDAHLRVWSGVPAGGTRAREGGFSKLEFEWISSNAQPLRMELYLHGFDPSDGAEVQLVKTVTYPSTGNVPVKRFQQIGSFLSDLGMDAGFPSPSQLAVDLTPAGIQVDEVYFGMWGEPADGSARASAVAYRFAVQ